jgi:transcriptional regulator with XRE-family HTH domain
MKNHQNQMTELRRAIYDAKITQSELASEAGVGENLLSYAATGRMPLRPEYAARVQGALAAHGVRVSLDDARGL